jgi:hypothetical protein
VRLFCAKSFLVSEKETTNAMSNSNAIAPQVGGALSQSLLLKLDRQNYTLWKTMVLAIVKGHQFEGYLSGTLACPSEFVTVEVTPEDRVACKKAVVDQFTIKSMVNGW